MSTASSPSATSAKGFSSTQILRRPYDRPISLRQLVGKVDGGVGARGVLSITPGLRGRCFSSCPQAGAMGTRRTKRVLPLATARLPTHDQGYGGLLQGHY